MADFIRLTWHKDALGYELRDLTPGGFFTPHRPGVYITPKGGPAEKIELNLCSVDVATEFANADTQEKALAFTNKFGRLRHSHIRPNPCSNDIETACSDSDTQEKALAIGEKYLELKRNPEHVVGRVDHWKTDFEEPRRPLQHLLRITRHPRREIQQTLSGNKTGSLKVCCEWQKNQSAPDLYFEPFKLSDFIWIQALYAVCNNSSKICPGCSQVFVITKNGSHKNQKAKWCSENCRKRTKYKEKASLGH